MKNKEDYIFLQDIISLLLFENDILRKKLNNIKLSRKELFIDNFIVPPSVIIRDLYFNSSRKGGERNV